VLCCALLCCAVLCFTALCSAVLCCVVQYCTVLLPPGVNPIALNHLTPKINPSAQRCLTRCFAGDFAS
jgi:hypothetical protein